MRISWVPGLRVMRNEPVASVLTEIPVVRSLTVACDSFESEALLTVPLKIAFCAEAENAEKANVNSMVGIIRFIQFEIIKVSKVHFLSKEASGLSAYQSII